MKAEGKIPKTTTSLDDWTKNKWSIDLSSPKYSNDNLPKYAIGIPRIHELITRNSKIQNYDFMRGVQVVGGGITIGDEATSIRGFSELRSVGSIGITSQNLSASDYISGLKSLSFANNIDIRKSSIDTLFPFKNIASGKMSLNRASHYKGQKPNYSTPFCKGVQSRKISITSYWPKGPGDTGALAYWDGSTPLTSGPLYAKDVFEPENNPWFRFFHRYGTFRYWDILTVDDLEKDGAYLLMLNEGEMLFDSDFPSVPISSVTIDNHARSVSTKGQKLLTHINWMKGIKNSVPKTNSTKLDFSKMPSLTNISGLSTLEYVSELNLSGDTSLSDISPLAGIKSSYLIDLRGSLAESNPDVLHTFKNMTMGSVYLSKIPSLKLPGNSKFCENYKNYAATATRVAIGYQDSGSTKEIGKNLVCY